MCLLSAAMRGISLMEAHEIRAVLAKHKQGPYSSYSSNNDGPRKRQYDLFFKTIEHRALVDEWKEHTLYEVLEYGEFVLNDLFRVMEKTSSNSSVWRHRGVIIPFSEATREAPFSRDDVKDIADTYVSRPEIQSNNIDYLLLDMLIYSEIQMFLVHCYNTDFGTKLRSMAFEGAKKSAAMYSFLKIVFWIFSVSISFGIPLSILLFSHSDLGELGGVLWLVILVGGIFFSIPRNIKSKRKHKKLLSRMLEVYALLRETTLSPRSLRNALDFAVAEGVVFDPQIFVIADRIYERDATCFVVGQ